MFLPFIAIHIASDHSSERPRQESLETDEGATSPYSLPADMEEVPDADGTPFALVTHRNDAPAGIPIIFKLTNKDSGFWRVNTKKLAAEIVTVTQEKLLTQQIKKELSSLAAANKLLALTTLAGFAVSPVVPNPTPLTSVKSTASIPLEYTEGELLEHLKDAGVVFLRRQASYYRKEDGEVEKKEHENVLLHFR